MSASPRRKGRHSALATTEDDALDDPATTTAVTAATSATVGRRETRRGAEASLEPTDALRSQTSEPQSTSSCPDPLSMEPTNGTTSATTTSTTALTTTAPSNNSVVSSILPLSQEHLQEQLDQTIKPAIHNFFYPQKHRTQEEDLADVQQAGVPDPDDPDRYNYGDDDTARRDSPSWNEEAYQRRIQEDRRFVHHFWRTYDDIIILSLFTQIGIVFRLATSTYLTFFDSVFSNDSALFVNLPLNSLSCFLMGMLSSGERLMEIISTRFTPPRLQQSLRQDDDDSDDGDDDDRDGARADHDDDDLEDGVHLRDAGTGGSGLSTLRHRFFGGLGRRRKRRSKRRRATYFHSWQPPVQLNSELREVQLLALERRIRASKCLLLFPVRKEDVDVMEHYFQEGYKSKSGGDRNPRRRRWTALPDRAVGNDDGVDDDGSDSSYSGRAHDLSFDLELQEESERGPKTPPRERTGRSRAAEISPNPSPSRNHQERRSKLQRDDSPPDPLLVDRNESNVDGPLRTVSLDHDGIPRSSALAQSKSPPSYQSSAPSTTTNLPDESQQEQPSDHTPATAPMDDTNFEEFFQDVQANVTENISRLRRVNLADGWDVGTTPDDMADDLLLGLRDGFCGALSSFSSWNSAMVNLMRNDKIGEAFVGYMLGIQLPIIAYRFGQHVAVFLFIWRCRFETRRDERRGYGIRLSMNEVSERDSDDEDADNGENHNQRGMEGKDVKERKIPSVRAIATALFIMALVTQCTSLSFFSDPEKQLIALSLLFSPLGVLARWRLSKLNSWRPTFPLGTFASNIIACTLSGSLGRLLEGNPGTRERIVLVSIISGFGGTLSSLAAFVVEILAGLDPILFRFDGVIYAVLSIFWAWVVGFFFSSKADWADQTT